MIKVKPSGSTIGPAPKFVASRMIEHSSSSQSVCLFSVAMLFLHYLLVDVSEPIRAQILFRALGYGLLR